MPKLKGIIPAMITPFKENGEVFEEGIINEIEYLAEKGITNIFALGSYGSFALMTQKQRMKTAETIIKTCKKHNILSNQTNNNG